jgi:YfiR/HmsC-like
MRRRGRLIGRARDALGRWLAVIAAVALAGAGPETPPAFEYQVKAAFIYTVTKFVEWPSGAFHGPGEPMTFCVLGSDPFEAVLEQVLSGKTVGGRSLTIRRLEGPADAGGCHVLFIGASEKDHAGDILDQIRGASVLTVGESERFAQMGGMMNLHLKENMVQFEVNKGEADKAGVLISSKILKLGRVVRSKYRADDGSP